VTSTVHCNTKTQVLIDCTSDKTLLTSANSHKEVSEAVHKEPTALHCMTYGTPFLVMMGRGGRVL
jgi:hypothetical protein